MQTQADLSNIKVVRPACVETTALGAAYLAGLAVGFWESEEELTNSDDAKKEFVPVISEEKRKVYLQEWLKAVSVCVSTLDND